MAPFSRKQRSMYCSICRDNKRPYLNHNTYDCRFGRGSRSDRPPGRSRAIAESPYHDHSDYGDYEYEEPPGLIDNNVPVVRSVDIMQSPYINTHYQSRCVRVTLDSGATSSFIRSSFAESLGLEITPSCQSARQADGVSSLPVKGEVHCFLARGDYTLQLDALVVDRLDAEVLAGMPFLTINDIAIRPAMRQIVVHGTEVISYAQAKVLESSIRRAQSYTLAAPSQQTVILPGEFVNLKTPQDAPPDELWAIEPRFDSPLNNQSEITTAWPAPHVVASVANIIVSPTTLRSPSSLSDMSILLKLGRFCTFMTALTAQLAAPCPMTQISNQFSHLQPTSNLIQISNLVTI